MLTDEAWFEICEAAGLPPGPEARAVLSTCLFVEYPALARDRKRVAETLRQSERMLKRLDAFTELYRQAWFPDDERTERDLWCLKMVRQRPEHTWLACRAIRRANRRRSAPQHEWLVSRLSSIWLWDFRGGDLTVTIPSLGGPPGGRLIRFLMAAMRQIMSELPSPDTLRDMIDRERQGRDDAKQLGLEFKFRANGVLTHEK